MTKRNNMHEVIKKSIKEYREKSKTLFIRGGLAVLLDYPPHDMVLDEQMVEKYLINSHTTLAEEKIKELEGEKTFVNSTVLLSNPPQYTWNSNEEVVKGYNKDKQEEIDKWKQFISELKELN